MDQQTEIGDWADLRDTGAAITAHDKATGERVGVLHYFFIGEDQIQFKDVRVAEGYRRRRVATALLRHLNFCHPAARINPGVRNGAGGGFMAHILANEADKVATNGILNVPLRTMTTWPGFDFANAQRLAAGGLS